MKRLTLGRMTLGRMTFGQRIAAVGALVMITIVIALYFFIAKRFSKDIAFTALERSGNQYQRPLETLLEKIPEHQMLARRYLAGQSNLRERLTEVEGRVDAGMQALHAVDTQLGVALQFTTEGLAKRKREHCKWDTLHQEWESLKSGLSGQSATDSDKAHAHLISDVRTMITHAGDTSNLILDSDLDSYYLMDATLVALPQTQDRLATIEMLGQDALGKKLGKKPGQGLGKENDKGKVAEEYRMQLAVAAALLKEGDLDRNTGDVQTALNEDQNFNGVSESLQQNLPAAGQEYAKANEVLLGLIKKLVEAPDAPVSESEFEDAANGARKASFLLGQIGAQELDVLLQKRISNLTSMRLWAFGWTALALLVSVGIAARVIRSTTQFLRKASSDLLSRIEVIAEASRQIAAASQELADGASQQAASLEQTSASSEEINSMARKNSENSHTAADLVTRSQNRFAEANRSLDQMVLAMVQINSESGKISKIIKVIDEIAFQTNILALNAAVEAARVGEAGMGFAVVADEVRNLAQRSAQAAKDTAELIEGSIAKSLDGKKRVDELAEAIWTLTEESLKIRALVDEVNVGSQEQTRGIEQLSKAMIHMEQVTQKNAASAEQTASSVEEMNAQSQTLREIVAEVTALAGGKQPHA